MRQRDNVEKVTMEERTDQAERKSFLGDRNEGGKERRCERIYFERREMSGGF